jgi:hypothetical protein
MTPGATEVCVTLHGPGYGLDEVEAFNSELAGLIDATAENPAGAALRTVSFVESDRGRAERMREILAKAIPGGSLRPVYRANTVSWAVSCPFAGVSRGSTVFVDHAAEHASSPYGGADVDDDAWSWSGGRW